MTPEQVSKLHPESVQTPNNSESPNSSSCPTVWPRESDPACPQAGDRGLGQLDAPTELASGSGSTFGNTGSGRQESSASGFRGTTCDLRGGVVGRDSGGLDATAKLSPMMSPRSARLSNTARSIASLLCLVVFSFPSSSSSHSGGGAIAIDRKEPSSVRTAAWC